MRWLVWNPCYSTLSPARYYTSILSIVSKVKSILKVIISAGPLVLTHTLLLWYISAIILAVLA